MTTAVAEAPVEPRRGRRWSWLLGALVTAVVVAITTTLLVRAAVRDEGYGPLEFGEATGTDGPGVTHGTDGSRALRPDAGPAYSLSWLDNRGTHDVRVAGIELNDTVRAAQWAPIGPESEAMLRPRRWRSFPATVPAAGTIQIRLTIGRPAACRYVKPGSGAGLSFSGGYTVRWQSRRSEHVTPVVAYLDSAAALQLC